MDNKVKVTNVKSILITILLTGVKEYYYDYTSSSGEAYDASEAHGLRPMISLKPGLTYSGSGTATPLM